MPLVKRSSYTKRPFFMINGHMETIIPSMFYKVNEELYTRERIELSDGDFLDLDWVKKGARQLMIISHGLEGGSDRYYVKRTAKFFAERDWDILAWNCRSCSGEMNRLPRFYHHGDTPDLHSVIQHALGTNEYDTIVLLGYSMGGSMSIKYLGENYNTQKIKAAVTFSVPVNLKDSALAIERKENRVYEKRFLRKLKEKIALKADMFPGEVSAENLDQIKEFDTFHERYTVPLHGFDSIEDFYSRASCDQYLNQIKQPVLIANAFNDPMLIDGCYPYEVAADSHNIFLDIPRLGGHVGFTLPGNREVSWMEIRTERFLQDVL